MTSQVAFIAPNSGPPPAPSIQFDITTLIVGPAAGAVTLLLRWCGLPPLFIATFLAVVGLCYAYRAQLDDEFLMRLLTRLIVRIFFREMQSRNAHNIPTEGPVIFICAPHSNQFLDPAVVQEFSPRPISWLIAQVSYNERTIGRLARAQRAIPVQRPQDFATTGPGKVYYIGNNTFRGINTTFTTTFASSSTSLSINKKLYHIEKVLDDSTLSIVAPKSNDFTEQTAEQAISYKTVPKIDQHQMFKYVWQTLCQGNAVGIFPEGGSHDRTELLPLKAGVAIMALGAAARLYDEAEEQGKDVSLTPPISMIAVGLNYFHGHRFRGRVYVEYGDRFTVPVELIEQYRRGGENKITSCNALLEIIKDQLKMVTVCAPSWTQLQLLWAVRRLYQPIGLKLQPKQVVLLIRRLQESYQVVKDRPEVKQLAHEVEEYNESLKHYGLRDHQVDVATQSRLSAGMKLAFRFLQVICLTLLSIPGSVLNLPILVVTRTIARRKAVEALQNSTVKIAARDVLASWKVLTSLTLIPLVLCIHPIIYATIFNYFFNIPWLTFWGNFVILQPAMMWSSVRLVETGRGILNSLKPLYLAVTTSPSEMILDDTAKQRRIAASLQFTDDDLPGVSSAVVDETEDQHFDFPHIVQLRRTRASLRFKIHRLVEELGPQLYGQDFAKLRMFSAQAQKVKLLANSQLKLAVHPGEALLPIQNTTDNTSSSPQHSTPRSAPTQSSTSLPDVTPNISASHVNEVLQSKSTPFDNYDDDEKQASLSQRRKGGSSSLEQQQHQPSSNVTHEADLQQQVRPTTATDHNSNTHSVEGVVTASFSPIQSSAQIAAATVSCDTTSSHVLSPSSISSTLSQTSLDSNDLHLNFGHFAADPQQEIKRLQVLPMRTVDGVPLNTAHASVLDSTALQHITEDQE